MESIWSEKVVSGEMILFSGHEEEDAPHTEGVALMLSRSAQKAVGNHMGKGSSELHLEQNRRKSSSASYSAKLLEGVL